MNIKQIQNILKGKNVKQDRLVISTKTGLSSGNTLLNLACSGHPRCCFIKGVYHYIVGDSSSGKTWLSLTCLAEAIKNKTFANHRFIYDNSENGALMDIEKYFGKKVLKKMEPPARINKKPKYSGTIEEFYYHIDDAIKQEQPFIYILDSMDSLSSTDEQAKFEQHKKAHKKGQKAAGSFGDGKAKKNSCNIRRLLTPLKESESILIVIGQTRDNLGFGFKTKTRSGGNALTFYNSLEMWSKVKKKIKKTVNEKARQIGIICQIKVEKNRLNGKERVIEFPIYHSFGMDDVGSNINYLIDEKHWKGTETKVIAPEFEYKGSKEGLVKLVEEKGLEKDLVQIVREVWDSIEERCAVKRKKRYE